MKCKIIQKTQAEYMREYRKRPGNRERIAAINKRYWEKKSRKSEVEKQGGEKMKYDVESLDVLIKNTTNERDKKKLKELRARIQRDNKVKSEKIKREYR